MRLPDPDPEAMRMAARLREALIHAASPGGQMEPALDIAREMVSRRLMDGRAEVMIALILYELSLQLMRQTQTPGTVDPYATLSHRLRDTGVLRQDDVNVAVFGRIANAGLAQGWLDAPAYDRLMAFGGADPQVRTLMAQIERRPAPPS